MTTAPDTAAPRRVSVETTDAVQLSLTFAAAQTPDAAQLSVAVQALARAVFISIALVIGVIGPVIVLQRQQERV